MSVLCKIVGHKWREVGRMPWREGTFTDRQQVRDDCARCGMGRVRFDWRDRNWT